MKKENKKRKDEKRQKRKKKGGNQSDIVGRHIKGVLQTYVELGLMIRGN